MSGWLSISRWIDASGYALAGVEFFLDTGKEFPSCSCSFFNQFQGIGLLNFMVDLLSFLSTSDEMIGRANVLSRLDKQIPLRHHLEDKPPDFSAGFLWENP